MTQCIQKVMKTFPQFYETVITQRETAETCHIERMKDSCVEERDKMSKCYVSFRSHLTMNYSKEENSKALNFKSY